MSAESKGQNPIYATEVPDMDEGRFSEDYQTNGFAARRHKEIYEESERPYKMRGLQCRLNDLQQRIIALEKKSASQKKSASTSYGDLGSRLKNPKKRSKKHLTVRKLEHQLNKLEQTVATLGESAESNVAALSSSNPSTLLPSAILTSSGNEKPSSKKRPRSGSEPEEGKPVSRYVSTALLGPLQGYKPTSSPKKAKKQSEKVEEGQASDLELTQPKNTAL